MIHLPGLRVTVYAIVFVVGSTGCATGSGPGVDPSAATRPASAASGSPAAPPSLSASASPVTASRAASPILPPLTQLPRGGRQIFPRFTVVAHYGTAGTGALGVLGEGTPTQAAARLTRAAAPFAAASGRPVLPTFELIASVAQRAPGANGAYSTYLADADVARYLAAARRARALLVLDLQPGRADFLEQAQHFEKFLRLPDVGLALDPEWKLSAGQLPSRQIGSTDAASINRVSLWLAQLRLRQNLPQKLLVLHQFRAFMIRHREQVAARSGLATVIHLDGFGTQQVKRGVYAALSLRGGPLHNGLKLFLDEDTPTFTPREAMAFRPRPELISYQ